MLENIEELIKRVNPNYVVEYEEKSMMNVRADEIMYNQPFAFIPEFMQGKYTKKGYFDLKHIRVEIFFCRFCQFENDAKKRDALRSQIEQEMVLPFVEQFEKEFAYAKPQEWRFFYPVPMFDANEVSVMIQFDFIETIC